MPNVNQGVLINKLLAFMEIEAGAPLAAEKQLAFRQGLCHGFSVAHAYMNATGKLAWWKSLLAVIAQWDTTDLQALEEEVDLPDADPNERNKTLGYLLKRAVNYILYNQAAYLEPEIEMPDQNLFLRSHGHFDSVAGEIVRDTAAAGYLDTDALESLLIPALFSRAKMIFIISVPGHACAIRCTPINNNQHQWWFYDPNYKEGEKSFDQLSDLINEIHARVGHSLTIQIASLNPRADTTAFDIAYQHLVENQTAALLQQAGIQLITKYLPQTLSKILELAATNPTVRNSLSLALKKQAVNGWTGLHMIARYAPEQLINIVELIRRENDPSLKKLLLESFAIALRTQNHNGWTGLHMIAGCAPEQLNSIVQFIKENYPGDFSEYENLLNAKIIDYMVALEEKGKLLPLIQKMGQTIEEGFFSFFSSGDRNAKKAYQKILAAYDAQEGKNATERTIAVILVIKDYLRSSGIHANHSFATELKNTFLLNLVSDQYIQSRTSAPGIYA